MILKDKIIYGVDFDGTLAITQFPEIISPNLELINYLKEEKIKGNIIILWTCRQGKTLEEAINYCGEYGLSFNYINENCNEVRELFNCDEGPKIGCDYYIDDKSIRPDEINYKN